MLPAFDRNTLDLLVSLGRERGHLTTADLGARLPIGAMSAEEIALIVIHLEEAGIPVELEEGLAPSAEEAEPAGTRSAVIIPFPQHRIRAGRKPESRSLPQAEAPVSQDPEAGMRPDRALHWAVALSGLFIFALTVGMLMLWGH